jgi:hypothetical protein
MSKKTHPKVLADAIETIDEMSDDTVYDWAAVFLSVEQSETIEQAREELKKVAAKSQQKAIEMIYD